MAAMQENLPNGGFGVSQGNQQPSGPAILPTPGSMPIAQQETPQLKQTAGGGGSSSKDSGGAGIGKAIGSIGGTLLGGPVGGAVGGFLGDIFGGLFSEGGFVGGSDLAGDKRNGFAEGGPTDNMTYGSGQTLEPPTKPQEPPTNSVQPQQNNDNASQQNPMHDALALGYLMGAYHTQHYGGTPDTLPHAAEEFKQLMSGQGNAGSSGMSSASPSMATGGLAQEDPNQAQDAMNQTLGTTNNQPPDMPSGMPSQMPSTNGSQGFANGMSPMRPPSVMAPMQPKGFADGGPPMMPPGAGPDGSGGAPPLQPGQAFQGDGSVKGPGGPTDDAIPAKLSNGEFVMSAPATQFFGVDKLNQMNQKGKEGFMQAVHNVDANQQQAGAPTGQPSAMPQMPSGGPGMMQKPPMGMPPSQPQMKAGGPAMRPKSSGYMGI